jgi:hypothetical protein
MQISTDQNGRKWISYFNYSKGSHESCWLISYDKFNKHTSKIIALDIVAVAVVYLPTILNIPYLYQYRFLSKYNIFIFVFLLLICNTGFKKVNNLQIIHIEKNCSLFLLHQTLLYALALFTFIKPYLY